MTATSLRVLFLLALSAACVEPSQYPQGWPRARELVVSVVDPNYSPLDFVPCKKIDEFVPFEDAKVDKRRDIRRLFNGCIAREVPYGSYRVRVEAGMWKAVEGDCGVWQERPVCTLSAKTTAFPMRNGVAEFYLSGAAELRRPLWLNLRPVFDPALQEGYMPVASYPVTVAFDDLDHARVEPKVAGLDCIVTLVSAGRAVASASIFLPGDGGAFQLTYDASSLTVRRTGVGSSGPR